MMIGNTPEQNKDFLFSHEGINYAIGVSEIDEAIALSQQLTQEKWTWKLTEIFEESYIKEQGGSVEYLQKFLDKVNEFLFGSIDETPESEEEKVLLMIKKLVYTPKGIELVEL